MDRLLRIVVAMIWCDDRLLLQLRDFTADIDDPGQWGLFGGHLAATELPDAGLRRELTEEVGWVPPKLAFLGHFDEVDRRIIGYAARMDCSLRNLRLGEGQDMGAFTIDEINGNALYSSLCKQRYPMTAITRKAVSLWSAVSRVTPL